jgi:hypothetical protein
MTGLGPVTHDFAVSDTASRGWAMLAMTIR